MYGEADMDYVRRQGNRYLIETRPTCHRFTKSLPELRRAFVSLEKGGYIYNLSNEAGRIRFYINFPKYLTFSGNADETERYVAESRGF
jgi:hypothetical protein